MRDEELISKARKGDRKAISRLSRRYYADLYAYFRSRLIREDAEDLTQVTLQHTVAKLERFRAESSFRHYVYSVARRVLFERHRRAGRRVDIEELGSEPPASETSPSERIYRDEFRTHLSRALTTLAEHYRVVVSLHLNGADNFEIAKSLRLEYNTVRSRLSRGLAAVRELLEPWVDEVGGRMPPELEPPSHQPG